MPTLTTTVSTDVDIEFSVYCGICGAGICGDTDVDDRKRNITVTCHRCAKYIKELEDKIEALEQQL